MNSFSPLLSPRSFKSAFPLLIIFTFLIFYWAYLAFVTQPILVHDAKGYQDLGNMIDQKGWTAYFSSGVNREPIYPFLVAISMGLTGAGSYLTVLKILQIFILFLTIILVFFLLQRAHVSKMITALTILYVGISPALINSALSVYSEIATYSFILGMVLVGSLAWDILKSGNGKMALATGAGLGALFVGITFVKGIYEMIFFIFLIPYVIWGVRSWRMKNKNVFKNIFIFLLTTIVIFQGCLISYKSLNKKYNGVFALTDRGAWALYGNTARRQEPLTVKKFSAGLAYNILERAGCDALFGEEACLFWDLPTSDRLAEEMNNEVARNFPVEQRDAHLLRLSAEKIIHHPLQYVLLTGFDWLHMFFWESTRIGFVAYPDWLDKIFDFPPFQKGLRFIIGFLSFASTLIVVAFLIRNKKDFWNSPLAKVALLTSYLIFWHVTFYSLFSTIPRFALPIAPLFILNMAFALQILISRNFKVKEY